MASGSAGSVLASSLIAEAAPPEEVGGSVSSRPLKSDWAISSSFWMGRLAAAAIEKDCVGPTAPGGLGRSRLLIGSL